MTAHTAAPVLGRTTFRHVPALDGLRGIAVAAVVVYHLWPEVVPGGFIGVDVFFVLSGFLLSALMVREAESTARFDAGRFVVRRVRRLLPATLLVLVALAAYAAVWAEPAELQRLREHVFGALTYTINWLFIVDGTTYTDVVVGASPLRHMWSLAIEEQFYIVLALAVLLLVRCSRGDRSVVRGRLGYGALGLAALSVLWMFILERAGTDAARLYFGTDTRAHAMLFGVALGALAGDRLLESRDRPVAPVPSMAAALTGAGLLVVFGRFATEDARWMFRGGYAVVALASLLLLVGCLSSRPVGRAFSFAPLVGLGTISYGVYLWHWPVLVILDADRLGLDGNLLAAAQIAITLALSVASYALVERPIRHGVLGERLGRRSPVVAPLAVVAVAVASITATSTATTPNDVADADAPVAQGDDDPALADPSLLQLAVVGDSVMHTLIGGDLGTGLEAVPWNQDQSSFDRSEVAITSIARPACSFLPGLIAFEAPGGYETADLSPPCRDWRRDLLRAVQRDNPVQVTVVMPTNDLEDREIDGSIVAFGDPEWEDAFFNWVLEVIDLARTGGSDVVLLAPAPRIDPNWSTAEGERESRVAEIFDGVAQANPDVEMIDLATFVGDDTAIRDDGLHYTDDGARRVAEWLTPQLTEIAG